MHSSRQLVQRISIATVVVIGATVAMLAVLVARTRALADVYVQASGEIDQLVLLEAACVVLLLGAIGLGVRLALRPTHARLEQTTAALADNESRTRAVLDAMDEGTLLFARDGSLLDFNPSAARILGLDDLTRGAKMVDLARRIVTVDGKKRPSLVTWTRSSSMKNISDPSTRMSPPS